MKSSTLGSILRLICCCSCAVLAMCVVGPGAGTARAANYGTTPKAETLPPLVLKFENAARQRYLGHDVLLVSGFSLNDGRPLQVAVPNEDEKSGKFAPRDTLNSTIKSLKPGDLALIEIEKKDRELWLKKIDQYKAVPGEEQPNVYKFYESYTKKEGDVDVAYVTLIRLGTHFDAIINMKRDGKTFTPDPDLKEKADKFKKDDLVEVELQPAQPMPIVLAIDAYKPPEEAKVTKLGESEVEGNPKYPTLELEQDGKAVSLPLLGKLMGKKFVADPRLVQQVHALKPGTNVLFRTREVGGKTYLRDIALAPKTAAAKPDAPKISGTPKLGTKAK